jgi:hypothetical protein
MARPICVNCGKPYGSRRVETLPVRWKRGEPVPPYRGDGIVVKEIAWTSASADPAGPGENVSYRTIWDGRTWLTPYEPFCKLRCALAYARKAYTEKAKAPVRRQP